MDVRVVRVRERERGQMGELGGQDLKANDDQNEVSGPLLYPSSSPMCEETPNGAKSVPWAYQAPHGTTRLGITVVMPRKHTTPPTHFLLYPFKVSMGFLCT